MHRVIKHIILIKQKKDMKGLVFVFAALFAVSFSSCGGNKTANTEAAATADSTEVTTQACDTVASTCDSTANACDSTANACEACDSTAAQQ